MPAGVLHESARRMSDCVTELLRKQPFFGNLVLRLPLTADPTRETLATDGQQIRYNPEWIAATESHFIETAMARVVMACALKHHTRRGNRDPERWQMASQLVTHALIQEAGFVLPPDARAWEDLSVEQAYDQLAQHPDDSDDQSPTPEPQPGDGPPDPSAAPGDPDDSTPNQSSDNNRPPGADDPADPDDPGDPSSDTPSHDPSGTGEVMDAQDRTPQGDDPDPAPLDVTAEEQAWDEAMHQSLNIARAQGMVPGQVAETIESAHATILDWRPCLRRYMTDATAHDYSWSVPNRRFIDSGLYLPSIRSDGINTIAFLIDSSWSLPKDILAIFWAELRKIVEEIRPENIHIIQVDTRVRDAVHYTADDVPETIDIKGRGGTDFRPGFAWLEENDVIPGVCIYFTDMECSDFPDHEPPYPVLWCDFGKPDARLKQTAPWGEYVNVAA